MITSLRLAVKAILLNASSYSWSVQGFGLLRLYIGREGRLHIWDSRLRYAGVSMIHNHSWDLRSTIVSGQLFNIRYVRAGPGSMFHTHRLLTGYHSKPVTGDSLVCLTDLTPERYVPGNVYQQRANEIHKTVADDGTITLMERKEDEQGEADVFWPEGEDFGTATPRQATQEEIALVCGFALGRL